MSWSQLQQQVAATVLGTSAKARQARAAIVEFTDWASLSELPCPAPLGSDDATLEKFRKSLEHHQTSTGVLTKAGEGVMTWAAELLRQSRNPPAVTTDAGAIEVTDDSHHESPMATKKKSKKTEEEIAAEQAEQETDEEEFEEEEEPEEEYEEEEGTQEEPAPRRRAPQRTVRYVERAPAKKSTASRKDDINQKLFPKSKRKIRVYKRDDLGKRAFVSDYTLEDIGNSGLEEFLQEVVHPRVANDSGSTEYIVYQVDPRTNQDMGPPSEIVVEDENQPNQQNPNDPFRMVHETVNLLDMLKERTSEPKRADPALQSLSQRAAAQGDITGVMMAMMMQEFMQGRRNGGSDEMKLILEELRAQRAMSAAPPGPMAFAPPPPSINDELLKMMMMKVMAPPPGLVDQAQNFGMLKQLFAPPEDPQVSQLKQEVARLSNIIASNGKTGGFDDALGNFERVLTTVKSFAPQVAGPSTAGSGIGSFLTGLLTPELGKTLANVMGQMQGAQPPGAPPQQAAPGAPVAPQPPVQQQAPAPVPAVEEAVKAFHAMQTLPLKAEKFAELVIAMYSSQSPQYMQMLQPAMAPLMSPVIGNEQLAPARRVSMGLLMELKPELATPDFVDTCLAALAAKVGLKMPEALVASKGRWTLDFRGELMMLDTVAKEVPPAEAAPAPAPAAPEARPPLRIAPPIPTIDKSKLPPARPLSEAPPERVKRRVEMTDEEIEELEKRAQASAAEGSQAIEAAKSTEPQPHADSPSVVDVEPVAQTIEAPAQPEMVPAALIAAKPTGTTTVKPTRRR